MAMNPCLYGPCDDPTHECNCTPPLLQRYISPISEPLLDRTDIHIDVPAVKYKELATSENSDPSRWLPAPTCPLPRISKYEPQLKVNFSVIRGISARGTEARETAILPEKW